MVPHILTLKRALDQPELLARITFAMVERLSVELPDAGISVCEIDPAAAAGGDFCTRYGVSPLRGGNCVIVDGRRGPASPISAACIAPVGFRIDFNGAVRRELDVRKVSVANQAIAVDRSNMEHGSITPVGLPADWIILVDSRLKTDELIYIGSGLKRSKLALPGTLLGELPQSRFVETLAYLIE